LLKLSELLNFNINPATVSIRFYPSEKVHNQASEWIKEINPDNKFLVGVNLSAGSKARFWGVEKFKLLLNSLKIYDMSVILFCTKEDLPLARQIGNDEQIYPFTSGFDIFAAAIMQIDLLITPDTSVVQIASINKIPLFGIYVKYKTQDMLWTPLNTDFDCVVTEEPNLDNITFEEVKNKLIPFLEKHLNAKTNS
jgi:heptosyltransferase III